MKEDRIPATQTSEQKPFTVFTECKDAGGQSRGGSQRSDGRQRFGSSAASKALEGCRLVVCGKWGSSAFRETRETFQRIPWVAVREDMQRDLQGRGRGRKTSAEARPVFELIGKGGLGQEVGDVIRAG